MPPVRLFAATLIAIAILPFGTFPNSLSSDVPLASTAHAESKLDALIDPKIREWRHPDQFVLKRLHCCRRCQHPLLCSFPNELRQEHFVSALGLKI